MDPRDNLKLAKSLRKKPNGAVEEAVRRCACGRAYYSAFGVVRDFLEAAKFSIPERGAHQRALILLQRSSDRDVMVAAGLFEQLRTTREQADYDVGRRAKRTFVTPDSERAILLSTQVISTIEQTAARNPSLFISFKAGAHLRP